MEAGFRASAAQPPPSPSCAKNDLFDHVLLAVASDDDARQTCRTLIETLGPNLGAVTVVTVIPRYRPWADGIPSDYRLEQAYATLDAACSLLQAVGIEAQFSIECDSNISRAIHEFAEQIDASVIAFTPRSANRLVDFLAGDITWSLVKRASRPVLVVPADRPGEQNGSVGAKFAKTQ